MTTAPRRRALALARIEELDSRARGIESPTPEQLARGGHERGGEGKGRGGVKLYRNRKTSPLRAAYSAGKLTDTQLDAGEWVEGLCRIVSGSPSGRSCLDIGPRGGGEENVSAVVGATLALEHLRGELGQGYGVLRAVAYDYERIGKTEPTRRRFRLLVEALDYAAGYRSRRR